MVLSGWKAIANYLKGGTRTVQRWEKEAGLPVLRPRPGPRGHVIAYSEQLDRWLKYSNGHRPDIPKIESEIHRTQQLLLRLSERTPEYASSTGWVAPPTCFVADRASQVLAGPSKSDSGITGEKSPLLQCRPCQLLFLHTSPFTRRRAPFRSI